MARTAALVLARRGDAVELYRTRTARPEAEPRLHRDCRNHLRPRAGASARYWRRKPLPISPPRWKNGSCSPPPRFPGSAGRRSRWPPNMPASASSSASPSASFRACRIRWRMPGAMSMAGGCWCGAPCARSPMAHPQAAAEVSLTAWFCATGAARAVSQALQAFGGYGLTTEYDIYLYNLRAKALALIAGDPENWLREGGRRRYGGEGSALPDVGERADRIRYRRGSARDGRLKSTPSWPPMSRRKCARSSTTAGKAGCPNCTRNWPMRTCCSSAIPDMGGRAVGPYAKRAARKALDRHGYNNPAAGVTEMVGTMIARFGSDELKAEVLGRMTSGASHRQPRLFRTRFGLRRVRRADPRRARWQRLADRRDQDVHQRREPG